MPLITRLANELRTKNPKNLFCIVEFGDNGPVFVYGSAMGLQKDVEVYSMGHSRVRFTHFQEGAKGWDGEERMLGEFDDLWPVCGKPEHITIVTAASPCAKTCAPGIASKAKKYSGAIKTWTILFHKAYVPDVSSGKIDDSLGMLNVSDGKVQIKCFPLHESFVDESTYH